MNGAEVIADILKREGTEFLSCYPRNPLIEASAALDIRLVFALGADTGDSQKFAEFRQMLIAITFYKFSKVRHEALGG